MCDSRHDSDNLMLGLLIGAVLGGIAGVLFAPDEGKKTREKLKVKLSEGKLKADELMEDVSEKVAEAREKAEPIIAEIHAKIEPVLEKVSEASEPVREQIAQYVQELKEEIEDREISTIARMKKKFFKGVKK